MIRLHRDREDYPTIIDIADERNEKKHKQTCLNNRRKRKKRKK